MPGLDSYTKLLLHMDDTGLTDSSASAHTITKNGDVARSNTQSKFGGYSAYFDGTGDYLSVADSTDWEFGSGSFTIDFWVRYSALPATGKRSSFFFHYTTDDNDSIFFDLANNAGVYTLRFYVFESTTAIVTKTNTITPSINTWCHYAIVRSGNDFDIYVDGVKQSGTVTDTSSVPNFTGTLQIGARSISADYAFNGYIDEYRVSKGIARWTADFTPPASPYSRSIPKIIMF